MKKSSNRIGGSVFVLIGVSFMAFTWHLYKGDRAFMQHSSPTMGIVVRSERVSPERGAVSYYPVVAFQTSGGRKYEFRNGIGNSRPIYKDGEQVPVRYEMQNPAKAKIAGFWELWGLTALFGGFGLVFVGVGFLIFRNGQ
ncbi:MAG: DUF3592 domain-containing protein [Spirosomataceae bacterium]